MADEDMPFVCSQPGCGMQFTNEDHLSVHLRKHDMSLALNLTPGGLSPLGLFTGDSLFDQTPTPTKFLKNCEEMGLFQELSKNPFDDSFKKAMDDNTSVDSSLHLPDADNNNLDTPQPPIPKIVIGEDEFHENQKYQDKPKDLSVTAVLPKKRKFLTHHILPTSTTCEDEEEAVIGSSSSLDLTCSSSDSDIISTTVPVHVASSMSVDEPNIGQVQISTGEPGSNLITEPVTATGSESSTNEIKQQFPAVTLTSNNSFWSPSGDAGTSIPALSSTPVSSLSTSEVNIKQVPIQTVPIGSPPAVVSQMITVMFQLPGGQVVPVQVPASSLISNTQMAPLIIPASTPQQSVINIVPNTASSLLITVPLTSQTSFQNTTPFTVKSTPQASVPTILNQSVSYPTLQTVLNQSGSQTALQTILNQSGGQSGLRTILVQNPQTSVPVSSPQTVHSLLATPQKSSKMQQKVFQRGSQSYTKERLKAAIQQQITPGSQRAFAVTAVKPEPQWSPLLDSAVPNSSNTSLGIDSSDMMAGSSIYSTPDSDDSSSRGENNDNEVRREKFLERNRAAAARCRQKKKTWVQNLERKAEDLSSVNSKLCGEIKKLRGEVATLKTLLLAHKDCPITMQQKSQGISTDFLILDNDTGDVLPVASRTTQTLQTLSTVSSTQANGKPSVSISANQSATQQTLPVRLVPNIITTSGDQIVSVITGTNTVSLIPKIINLYNSIPTPNSKS